MVFDEPPERIVAFDSAAVETLFAMGEGHRVVATHSFVSYPPEADSIPRVGGAFDMNIEATVALEPDLVFIFFDRFLPDLERAGLKVLYIQTLNNDFEKVADQIRMWGQIVGNPTAAERVASDFTRRIEEIRARMAPYESGPVVMQDEGALWTPGPDTLVGEVFDLLKLQNIAHDVSGYAQLSPEVIVERNPQLIITFDPATFLDNPAFSNVLAVKNDQVYATSGKLSVAGPRFVEGIEELAALAYPGLFRGN
ncbi:MAG: ABC transporter substrate-binding protein [Chloroflexi bacterium]|nr:ABC transporter substrate-binding protein [Chloroflexota bacterium]